MRQLFPHQGRPEPLDLLHKRVNGLMQRCWRISLLPTSGVVDEQRHDVHTAVARLNQLNLGVGRSRTHGQQCLSSVGQRIDRRNAHRFRRQSSRLQVFPNVLILLIFTQSPLQEQSAGEQEA